ncbi:hypothetical protein AQUCO_01600312v1 [Aquilegia coerulea]|uniref:Dof zinc finger protein n=1 Tax=Aquilegia coerulea TaxID=218851 RepID=A0A2G5DRU9_AQUCA|nr:hypothetical protein AQUCO_01600312v1 [Aquilegia coerulea]
MSQVALTCPRCESTNTKFAYYQDQKRSKPVHFCNNCLHYWTVGERRIQQPETSMANQASMCQVALKCPRCESINTKFVYYQLQNGSKPVHFCKDCRRHWTVGALLRTRLYSGGKRRRRQLKDPGLRASVEGPDSQAASKETTEVVQTKCTQETEHQNLSSCLLESIVKDNRGQEKKRQSDGSGEMASDGGTKY